MQKLQFNAAIIILLFFTSNLFSQSFYTTIGESGWKPYCVWKIKVYDEHNGQPLSNAKVELFDDTYKIFSIWTNREGIAIVIIYNITKIGSFWSLKIHDNDYSYSTWEKEINQYDYYGDRSLERMLILGDANDQIIDWSNGNALPSTSKIANDISSGKYRIFEQRKSNYYYRGPGFFEFDVKLQYKSHPKDQIQINTINENIKIEESNDNSLYNKQYNSNDNNSEEYKTPITDNKAKIVNFEEQGDKYFIQHNYVLALAFYEKTSELNSGTEVLSYKIKLTKDRIQNSQNKSGNITQGITTKNNEETVKSSENTMELQFNENFEDYSLNRFPSTWSADANAKDIQTNKIVYDNDMGNSLKLYGSLGGCWGALAYKPVKYNSYFILELTVKNGSENLSGCHPDRADVGLRQGTSWNNPSRNLIHFDGDGKIYSSGKNVNLGIYKTGKWYQVKIKYLKKQNEIELSYWINDEFKGSESIEFQSSDYNIKSLELCVQEGSAWFDNIKFYTK